MTKAYNVILTEKDIISIIQLINQNSDNPVYTYNDLNRNQHIKVKMQEVLKIHNNGEPL